MITTLAALSLVASGAVSTDDAEGGEEPRPNVLLIITDDQRRGLQVMRQTRARLRERGVDYPRAHATTPICCPARATIFTGLYAHNHGVRNNFSTPELDHSITIQRYLHDAGYRTGLFGKFLNLWGSKNPPPNFDEWAVYGDQVNGDEYYRSMFNVNGEAQIIEEYSTDFLTRMSVDFIESNEADDPQPWLTVVTPNAPHRPSTPEADYASTPVTRWEGNPAVFEADRSDKPPYVQAQSASLKKGRAIRRQHFRTLMSVDDMVDSLVSTLKKHGELGNTLIVFMSDNGVFWGEHGLKTKGAPYQPVLRVPMVLRWDGHLSRGATDRRLVTNADIAPTILQATGLSDAPAHELDGRSLLDPTWQRDRLLHEYWPAPEADERPRWASLQTRGYHYTELYDENDVVVFKEYYDLNDDPWELDNLLGDLDPLNDPDWMTLSTQLAADRECEGSSCP
ncbi:MAG: sulfatase [Actinomycetota bacterium]|nr:sulfatase [Actinomycetota bacterium]